MSPLVPRAVFAIAAVLAMLRSCGFEPDDRKGEGEPCTRTSECELSLECRGGVCMPESFDAGGVDAGDPGFDAGELDAGDPDAGGVDAGELDAGELDASSADGDAGDDSDAAPF